MKQLSCDVLVIGGGATGTGLARDLAMRGLKTILVERRDLSHGTTGRYHGLLHSGGRYVVKDPQAAHECYQENLILRRIMPSCIEDTGGFFVLTPQDDPTYASKFLDGCHTAGIPVDEIPLTEMMKQEPMLNPRISRCFRVPDGAADSFLAANLNAESARQYHAEILTYHEVLQLTTAHQQVTGAVCRDLVNDEDVRISATMAVNAAGAWAGKVAASAGITIQMIPGKGTMLALNHRIVHTVINRCKMPSDGDILVPAHTVAVIGTTDVKVVDPDQFGIEPWEIRLMLDEGEKLIPSFRSFRILRAWAGVRPLFQETVLSTQNRDMTRAFVLLDHEQRDGMRGLLTITSGKWTTYRKMAELTADKVCAKLGYQKECRTHLEALPSHLSAELSPTSKRPSHTHRLGSRLAQIEHDQSYGKLVCECELVTAAQVEKAVQQPDIHTLDDIRRDLRLGMGPCQGAFCTLRAAGILLSLRHPPILELDAAMRDFLEERWKGQFQVLWGQQLRQVCLNQYIFQDVLNASRLPGAPGTRLAADKYVPLSKPPAQGRPVEPDQPPSTPPSSRRLPSSRSDILVIGAGLAGLTCTWRALQHAKRVHLVTKGWGATHWGSGCIDLHDSLSVNEFRTLNPHHPYALAGQQQIEIAFTAFQDLCASVGYPMRGSIFESWLLPTALGTLRATCLAPEMMSAGDARHKAPMLIVGFAQLLDFFPELIAENLNAQGILANHISLNLPALQSQQIVNGMLLARLFDTSDFRKDVIGALRGRLGHAERIGFPAVLGLKNPLAVKRELEEGLGLPLFEIPGLPPSIPGIRLHNLLVDQITNLGGRVMNGMPVIGHEADGQAIRRVFSEASARTMVHTADEYVLATGGLLGGGIHIDDQGIAQETALGIPVQIPTHPPERAEGTFLTASPRPERGVGLAYNAALQPLDPDGHTIYTNLHVVGATLGGIDPVREHSLEGIALVTGFSVGECLS